MSEPEIYIHGAQYGDIWLRCDSCGTSSKVSRATHGIRAEFIIEWVTNHKCSPI